MEETKRTRNELLNAIQSSTGMEHVNRSHQRTFSLNIFRMNAQELIEITRRVSDPDEGLRLMSRDNQEAGKQVHREVTRRVHNFVAASLTLVEHTRIFMREHYVDSPLLDRYQAKVDTEFANDPLVKFVQDLRNFMLHKGLPNSEMFLNFQSNPALPGSGDFTTGIRIRTVHLLTWSRWSDPALAFIKASGQFLEISSFAEAYTDKVLLLHDWLQGELDQSHLADLDELRTLQASLNQFGAPPEPLLQSALGAAEALECSTGEPEEVFCFAHDRAAVIDAASSELLKNVREIHLPGRRNDGFATERPVAATITEQELIEAPLFWGKDVEGLNVFVFIHRDGGTFGFDEAKFAEMQTLAEGILKLDWARRMLSRSFVEDVIVQWLRSKFSASESRSLSETISETSRLTVEPLQLWAPIAHLEVQAPFVLGPVEVAPITKTMMDGLEARTLRSAPNQRDRLAFLVTKLRKDMQGLAAVVFKAVGERRKIKEDGEAIARIAVGLLRFLSPAAVNFPMVCANALLGSEVVPKSNLLILRDEQFVSHMQAVLSPGVPDWRISESMLSELRPTLDVIGRLLWPEGLSSFALAARSSLLLFGTGSTFSNPIERLIYTLSSLEALLLRHSVEPAEFNVIERMGLLLAKDRPGREEIARNVRAAYRLRARQDISPLVPHEIRSMAMFLRHAHRVIGIALANVEKFSSVAEFVVSVDNLKSQSAQYE